MHWCGMVHSRCMHTMGGVGGWGVFAYQALRRGWVELTRKSDRWSILRKPRRKQQLARRMVNRPVIVVLPAALPWLGEYTFSLIVVGRVASQSSEDREVKDDDADDDDEDTTDAEQSLRS